MNQIKDMLKHFIEWGGEHTENTFNTIENYMLNIFKKHHIKSATLIVLFFIFIFGGLLIIWIASFSLPDLKNFEERRVSQSTKIYDRTGDVVLFDVHGEITRTVVPYEEISDYVKKATVAIEDSNFYNHNGIEPSAILRAIFVNLKEGNLLGGQGGSTITQQVLKNSLLTSDKKISRKIKEWVLAPRLESLMTKDEILHTYLNEVPYGGTVYGVQEASRRFFGKDALNLTLSESAYLAALPQAPTYFSPYGNHLDRLENRKNKVLSEMLAHDFINQKEYDDALTEKVSFQKPENFGIKGAHFVMYIREQLEEKYGTEAVEQGGLKVITTLDWELQEKAEEIVKARALENEDKYDAENASLIAIDPNTGQILVMVGSRDYFDEKIDGNFNIATANRQPGSAFKPFVYAEAFNKGYRPSTVVFDLKTEFSTTCSGGGSCYNPDNYDNIFRGPMTLRDALAQSVNVPAVKVLYLAGISDALNLAKNMGIETLTNVAQYGLTLVLGGGEVRPLDMASAYGVFATGGIKHPNTGILRIEDREGNVLEEYKAESERVLPEQTALLISDVLTDNIARTPAFGSNSFLYFPNADVAAKTGTTNDYRDAWIVGYTPKISVAAWAGNNDNRSMSKKVAGFIIAPLWNDFMKFAIEQEEYAGGTFPSPAPLDPNVKSIIAGFWKGEELRVIQEEDGEQKVVTSGGGNVHSILHFVNKNNPLGPAPTNPNSDPQYAMWEYAVSAWAGRQGFQTDTNNVLQTTENNNKAFYIVSPDDNNDYFSSSLLVIAVRLDGAKLAGGSVFINGIEVGSLDSAGASFSFTPNEVSGLNDSRNTLEVVARDTEGKEYRDSLTFGLID